MTCQLAPDFLHRYCGQHSAAPTARARANRQTALLAASALAALGLSGCALQPATGAAAVSASAVHLEGNVHGGQQPVAGATVQLYAAGSAGPGSAATPLLTASVVTDAAGGFNITGDYTCPSPGAQVYLAATGGNPGLPSGSTNAALALLVALGDCAALPGTPHVSINEITTAAAAWALAPFSTSATQVGASATNLAGLRNAMGTAMLLADPYTGAAPAALLPANGQPETAKLLSLANLLAGCVNSDGGGPCTQLFTTVAVNSVPQDTFAAALSVAANPTHSVLPLFAAISAQAPFAGGLSAAPGDWSMSISYTGGGLAQPTGLTVDAAGSVWVADASGAVAAFSPQGVPAAPAGYTGGSLLQPTALAADSFGSIWVANTQSAASLAGNAGPNTGSVVQVSPTGVLLSSNDGYRYGAINTPVSVAVGQSGAVWVADSGTSVVTVLGPDGALLSSSNGWGAGVLADPLTLAIDGSGDAWVSSATHAVLTRYTDNGVMLSQVACCAAANALAVDGDGFVWAGGLGTNTLARVSPAGVLFSTGTGGGGLQDPQTIAIDSRDHLWIANSTAGTLSEFAGTDSPETAGSALSPATGLGRDAGLHHPWGTAVDSSGNLWVSSHDDGRLVKFVGLATPVRTPQTGPPAKP